MNREAMIEAMCAEYGDQSPPYHLERMARVLDAVEPLIRTDAQQMTHDFLCPAPKADCPMCFVSDSDSSKAIEARGRQVDAARREGWEAGVRKMAPFCAFVDVDEVLAQGPLE